MNYLFQKVGKIFDNEKMNKKMENDENNKREIIDILTV